MHNKLELVLSVCFTPSMAMLFTTLIELSSLATLLTHHTTIGSLHGVVRFLHFSTSRVILWLAAKR